MARPSMLLLLSLLTVAGAAHAQKVYKWVMPDGSIRYSDRPQEQGAVEREVIDIDVPPSPAPAAGRDRLEGAGPAAPEPEDATFEGYETFVIASPAPDEAIRDNGGNVSVQLDIEPPLQEGHVIEILMDGKSIGSGRSTRVSLTNVDRGSHTVRAAVRDENGEQLASTDAVTFNLLRVAAGT